MRNFFRQPFLDVLAALEQLAGAGAPPPRADAGNTETGAPRTKPRAGDSRGARVLVVPFVTLVVTWFVYVPIHELLHVLGCVATGGTVTRLELSARYGANLLSKVFPFVVSGSDYAGQLKGFDTHGSDLCYLATDFLPFVLSILIGVPLVKLAGRGRRPIVFGMAIVLGLAPFYNLSGDYFEMASIITTRSMATVTGGGTSPGGGSAVGETVEHAMDKVHALEKLRSDDVFRLLSDFTNHPEKLGLETLRSKFVAVGLIAVSAALAVVLSFGTYWAGHVLCRLLQPRPRGAPPLPAARR